MFRFLLYLFCWMTFLPASAQDTLWYFEQAQHDVGRFSKDQFPVTHRFRLLNGSNGPMEVTRVDTDCACTVAEFTKSSIAPGDYGYVDVIFRPYMPGPFEKTFTVYASGIYPTKLEIALNGFVEPFFFEPDLEFPHARGNLRFRTRQVYLGNITNHVPVKKKVEIYNPKETPFVLSDSVFGPPYIEVVFDSSREIQPQKVGSFTLFYHPEIKNDFGAVIDQLVFYEDGTMEQAFDLPISASIKQYFTPEELYDPDRPQLYVPNPVLHLGRIELTDTLEVEFELKNTGGKELLIQKIVANYGCETQELESSTIAPNDAITLTVNILDINKLGEQDRSLVVYCTDPVNTTQKLSITLDDRK